MAVATRSSNDISSKDFSGIFGISNSASEELGDSARAEAGGAAAEGFSSQPPMGGRGSGI